MMATILFFLMLLVWLSLAVYQDEAAVGCLMLVSVPFIAVLMLALDVLVRASTLGRKSIRYVVVDEEVQS